MSQSIARRINMKDNHRLLVVDDDLSTLQTLGKLINSWGYYIEPFSDSQLALTRAKDNKFDLIITDYQMPSLNGVELVQAIKVYQPNNVIKLRD